VPPVSLFDVAVAFFIGMGPIKIVVAYLAMTHGAAPAIRRRVAIRTVVAATATAIALVFGGALLLRLFHIESAALIIAGGLVMIVYGLMSVVEGPIHEDEPEAPSDAALLRAAIFPLAVPLLLNPAGIAAAMILSVELVESGGYVATAVVVMVIAAIDLAVLLFAGRAGHRIPYAAITILEKVFGTLLVAIGVQLLVVATTRLGLLAPLVPH
jgi:multiple antibiotic resistance protein